MTTVPVLRRWLMLGLALAACAAAPGRPLQAADGPYRFADRVRLGMAGVEYVFDAANGRLYSSASSFPRGVFVINTAKPGIADRFGEVPFGSIDVAPDLNELFVLSVSEHRIRVVDLSTRKVVRTLDAPAGHAVFFEPSRQELYVVGIDHRNLTILNEKTGLETGRIRLAGEPSFIAADRTSKRIFVRLIDHGKIQVIDPLERAIVATWTVDSFRGSTMAVDPEDHRLFVSAADKVVMLDSASGEELARVNLEYPVLALAFDPATRMLMASTPVGLIVCRAERAALTAVQTVSVGMSTSMLFLNPRTHAVYAVGTAAERSVEGGAPNQSATLLVFEYN